MRATRAALRECSSSDVPRFPGGFNEQALSNLVCAFDDTMGLDDELMSSVFFISAQRIRASGNVPAFKPKVRAGQHSCRRHGWHDGAGLNMHHLR